MAQDDIQGQVVDGAGNPVSGAIVELTKSYQSSPLDEQVVRRTTTDANGNYIFEFHPDGDGTTQEWHVSAYNHDGTAYVNSFNNPGVTADLPEVAIPDSVIGQYQYEDDSDTTTTIDSVGSNDGAVNGGSFVTTSAKGDLAYSNDSDGNHVESSQSVDLFNIGTTGEASVGGFVRPESPVNWVGPLFAADDDNFLAVQANSGSGNWRVSLQVNNTPFNVDSGVAYTTGSYDHVFAVVDDTELGIFVNGTLKNTANHGLTPSNIGLGNIRAGILTPSFTGGTSIHDNTSWSDQRLTQSEIQSLIDQ